ncbi:hypothetical protein [Caulobacter rhizosphaerae]|uniref:hypothetical protein n=1 Tax=Caulobacter rhizosphaerae TaxID=2010972 RepID=UPI0013D624A8|nr:hypothetical protein [Caulobacter rhizosphaerae]GGL34992.1 hypothetical protein GCM10010983_35040 [Caulobacter rhizosphaerae]
MVVATEIVGKGRVERTAGIGFDCEYTDVGQDSLSPVTKNDANPGQPFVGEIAWVVVERGRDSQEH